MSRAGYLLYLHSNILHIKSYANIILQYKVSPCYPMGSKSSAPCLQSGQMKSAGSSSPS